MRFCRILFAFILVAGLAGVADAQAQQPRKKRVLAIGATQGFQHDSVSTGLATIYNLGKESGLWDTYIRTDTQLITKGKVPAGNAKNLDYFDAIYFYTTGELPMDDQQKADLLAFVRDDGKGFIGGHSSIDTFYKWPEYGEMVGAWFDQHPWNTFEAPIIVENFTAPMSKHLPRSFTIRDEIYQPSKEFSREKVDVLARLDESKLDLNNKRIRRTDKDWAVAWVKTYGKGRVFYTTFGHVEEAYTNPDIRKMYLEAVKWALRLTDYDPKPHPKPAGGASN
jgi:type 1 glutamine amidotransferase